MGFEVPETHVRLAFTNPSYSGLEVVCRLVPLNELADAAKLATVDPKSLTTEDLDKVDRLVAAFGKALVSWNLTRAGKKVPATLAGVRSLDLMFAMQIISAWLSAVGQVLAQQANGDPAMESGLGVEAL